MLSAVSPPVARHQRLLGVALLMAAVLVAAGWPALASSAAVAQSAAVGDGMASADRALPADGPPDCQYQWSGHSFALPNPGQSHQGQLPPVRLAIAFGDSAWNAIAADVGCAVVITAQRVGSGQSALRSAPLWGSLQVQGVRLQI